MFSVEISIPGEDRLSEEMSMMRTWLDNHRCEPTMFRHQSEPHGTAVKIEFSLEAEAKAFALAFGGKLAHAEA